LRMSRIVPVSYKKLVRVLELEGFTMVRERGDHMIFTKLGILRPIVVPRYDALPVFIVKNVLRTASISRERYFELLDRV
jgi:predicted RNA binding protein YcfA (HicA-like mRNA interferase family)